MLEEFKDLQTEFYDSIKRTVENNKISHAYLIDTSSYVDGKKLVISFAKYLLCKNHYLNKENCDNCNQCLLIDNDNFKDLHIIRPDGNWIRKEQILKLKDEFSTTSLDHGLRIYIIEDAEKLNKHAGNSLLKFLEEPEENIIGILVTNNRHNVLNTLVSRCQVYKLKNNKSMHDSEKVTNMFDFAMNIERNGIETICYLNEIWHSKKFSKEQAIENFDILEEIYMDILKYNLENETKFVENIKDIEYISKYNDNNKLLKKIKIINESKENLKYNLNMSLFLDKFIIDFIGGVIND